jgi:hypothetical protein
MGARIAKVGMVQGTVRSLFSLLYVHTVLDSGGSYHVVRMHLLWWLDHKVSTLSLSLS